MWNDIHNAKARTNSTITRAIAIVKTNETAIIRKLSNTLLEV